MAALMRAVLGILLGLLFALALTVFLTGAAYAAPATPRQQCAAGAFQQHDMAGTYESRYMFVQIEPCGGVLVLWLNEYGEHQSWYLSGNRIPDGGIVAYGYSPDPELRAYLDSAAILAVKPAERGYVQVATFRGQQLVNIYRLMKTS